jgi:hypothetical protein
MRKAANKRRRIVTNGRLAARRSLDIRPAECPEAARANRASDHRERSRGVPAERGRAVGQGPRRPTQAGQLQVIRLAARL